MGEEEKQFYNAVLVLALLIGVIIAYFIITIIRYHRRYIRLQKDRIHAEIQIQENERKRIASDLHDSLGPLLSAVKLNISSIEITQPDDQRVIQKTTKYLDEIIGSMRQISYNLLPNTLERKGLIEAVREFIAQVSNQQSLQIKLFVVKEAVVPKDKEIHIFRMIQEIIQNTIKHANASNLQIGISSENKHVMILTKDDGQGFDIAKVKSESGGLGLKSLESRCEILNGILSLESEPGKGTNCYIKIPCS
jgi:signal transduction histidine kinase